MKKPKTISKLKKEADRLFSLYIRNKYAVDGMVRCYTCQTMHEIKKIQCGHFVSRTHISTRFLEDNCRPQCFACNVWKRGNYDVFSLNLIKEMGVEHIEYLNKKRNELTQYKVKDYEALIEDLKEKLKIVV